MASKTPSHRMQGLLGEFKKLYEGRLAKLKSKQLITSTSYQAMSGGDGGSGKIEKDWKVSLQNYEVTSCTICNCVLLTFGYVVLLVVAAAACLTLNPAKRDFYQKGLLGARDHKLYIRDSVV